MPDDTTEEEVNEATDGPGQFAFMDPTEESYTAFDPSASSDEDHPGPPVLSEDAPLSDGATPTTADQEEGEEETPPAEIDDLPKFDERYKRPFEGLLFLGALKKTFKWMNHEFVIKSLTADELMKIGLMIDPWSGTAGATKAYQAASIAAAIVTVDDQPIRPALGVDDDELQSRFDYIRKNWYTPVIDVLYQQVLELEGEVGKVLNAMGEASG